jgi:hypothetical protein
VERWKEIFCTQHAGLRTKVEIMVTEIEIGSGDEVTANETGIRNATCPFFLAYRIEEDLKKCHTAQFEH